MNIAENINPETLPLPSDDRSSAINWEKLKEKNPAVYNNISTGTLKLVTDGIFGNSPYLSDLIIKHADFYQSIFENGFENEFNSILQQLKDFTAESDSQLMQRLRLAKQHASLLIAAAEITGVWPIAVTTEKLSNFADLTVSKAAEFLLKKHHNNKVISLKNINSPFEESGLVIIALGKLGSNELNYSSDIDLCVFYEDEKLEYKGRITLGAFYVNLAQELVKLLSERTKDGYVFRVDMRLRPDPGSNPLAVSLKKAENYYNTVGQNWERAAYIKQRFICGDAKSDRIFQEFMERNVWRMNLDFETIEDIHSIKRQIDTRQGLHPKTLYGYNVKLGRGGIREIEFFVQTQQLIWGGKKPRLRAPKVSDILFALVREGHIDSKTARDLIKTYSFYRMVEHRLQMVNDEQTHTMPKFDDGWKHIAMFCGYHDTLSFVDELHKHIARVREYYSHLFETSPSLASDLPEAQGSLIFTGTENHPDTIETLNKMGFKDAEKVSDLVRGWHHGRYLCTKSKRARAELTKLMPHLFIAFAKSPNPDKAFVHFDEFLSKLHEDNKIFSLLYVNQNVMELLAEIMGGYPQIADNISRNPRLIEYVLAPEFYDKLPDVTEMQKNLLDELKNGKDNLESAAEIINRWTNEFKFRVGVQLIRGSLTTEKLFLSLSDTAETTLRVILKLVQKDIEKQYTKIPGGKLAVVAFGKFGSRELTFKSDLDLVFVYDSSEDNTGISAAFYYSKFTAKVVSLLENITALGKLYDVDMRLRPLGESGPPASSIKSFDAYYNSEKKEGSAWVFEYIALTRARVISLDKEFENRLARLIKEKLEYKWDEAVLYREAKYIHEKFRKTKKQQNIFDIKNAIGGLFDVEFLIRYLQLKNLHTHPEIYTQSTALAIDMLRNINVITSNEYGIIRNAYTLFKEIQNILRITSETEVSNYALKLLCRVLGMKNATELENSIETSKTEIKNLFAKYI